MTRLAEIKLERDQAQTLANLYLSALQLVSMSEPDASCVLDRQDNHYTLSVYGSERSNGGILIERFAHTGQADYVSVYVFEDWAREARKRTGLSADCTAFAIAAERLQLAIAARQRVRQVLAEG